MGRIDQTFARLREARRGGLMPFICGGHPTPGATAPLLRTLARAGADIVEIGIPFSDPIADGPVIASAMYEALEAGVTPQAVFDQVRQVRDELDIGIVAMASVSLVLGMGGPRAFVDQAKQAGFDGFIFPDVPLGEADELLALAADAGLTASLLVAPTTTEDRARAIAKACTGFVYLLARAGITGEQHEAPEVAEKVAMLRRAGAPPVACGFGISTAEHVRAVVEHADAAIVGSALVRRLSEAQAAGGVVGDGGEHDPVAVAEAFVTDLSTGVFQL